MSDIDSRVDNNQKLLYKAFLNCDKSLLIQLIKNGIDLNLVDGDGIPLWDNIRDNYNCYIDEPIANAIKEGEKTTKELDVCGFLDLAIDNGLDLSRTFSDAGIPYIPLVYLIYYTFSPTLLSFLVKKGVNMNIVANSNYTLLGEICEKALYYDGEGYEAGHLWGEWVFKYLEEHGECS